MRFLNKSIYKVIFFIIATALMLYPVMPNDYISSLYPADLNDKVEHATVFFILSLLLNRASATRGHRLRNVIALSFFGIVIELIQHFIPYRSTSLNDALANIVGILIFQFLFSIYLFSVKNKYMKSKENKIGE